MTLKIWRIIVAKVDAGGRDSDSILGKNKAACQKADDLLLDIQFYPIRTFYRTRPAASFSLSRLEK